MRARRIILDLISSEIFHNCALFLVNFLLFLLQFVYIPVGRSYFEISKVYASEIGIFSLLLVSIFSGEFGIWKKRKLLFSVFLLLFSLSLYHLLFHGKAYTFWGNPFRMQGTLLIWFLLLLVWLSSAIKVKKFWSFFVLFSILSVQVLLAFWVNSGSLERAVGSLGEPNSLAGEAVFLWPFVISSIKSENKKYRLGIKMVYLFLVWSLVGLVIFVSGSRSGVVAFFLQIVLLGLVKIGRISLKWTVVICFVLLFLAYSLPFLEQSGLYENRGEVWQSAILAGLRHPLLGSGFGNVEYALHEENLQLGNHLRGYYVDSSHNVFLDWFVEGGLVGLGLFLVLLGKAMWSFVKRNELLLLVLLFGLLGIMSFNPVSVVLLVAFWWVLGQGWQY